MLVVIEMPTGPCKELGPPRMAGASSSRSGGERFSTECTERSLEINESLA